MSDHGPSRHPSRHACVFEAYSRVPASCRYSVPNGRGWSYETARFSSCGGCSGKLAARGDGDKTADDRISRSTQSVRYGCVDRRVLAARQLGWIEGRTILIEYRWADGSVEHLADLVTEFVRLKVAVIVTGGSAAVVAAKQTTSVVPIVFGTAADPVRLGACCVTCAARRQHHRFVKPVNRSAQQTT